jgi:tRNA(Arg) A34 adenosine deaminase TadA
MRAYRSSTALALVFAFALTIDDEIVLTGQNTSHTDRDPTAHADTSLVALAQAS